MKNQATKRRRASKGTEDVASDKNQGKPKKKRWRKFQQVEARKDAKKRNRQSRMKPHREEKRSTEANDEAHSRKQAASTSTGPGSPAEGTETKSQSNPSIEIKGKRKTHLTQRVTPSRRNTNTLRN